jgi:hypothetical protein
MTRYLHLFCASLLLLSHGTFLSRSIFLLRSGGRPARLDRLALHLSQILIPFTILTGLFNTAEWNPLFVLHISAGLSPLPLFFLFRKKSFRKKHPLFLPGMNAFILAAAWMSGVLLH